MKSFAQYKKEALKDRDLRRAYNESDLEFQIIRVLIRQRIQEGVTQADLARKIGTKQSAIARFESGLSNPTLAFVKKVSHALDLKLMVSV